jgi:hypothetical protein
MGRRFSHCRKAAKQYPDGKNEPARVALNLDRETVVATLPIKIIRDAIREINRHDGNSYGWSVEDLAGHLKYFGNALHVGLRDVAPTRGA